MATNTNLNPMYANNYHGATNNNRTDINGSNGVRMMDGEQYARVFQQQQEMMMSRQIYSEGNQVRRKDIGGSFCLRERERAW